MGGAAGYPVSLLSDPRRADVEVVLPDVLPVANLCWEMAIAARDGLRWKSNLDDDSILSGLKAAAVTDRW